MTFILTLTVVPGTVSTIASFQTPLNKTLKTSPVIFPCSRGTISISSGLNTTSTFSFGLKPKSTQSKI